MKKYGYILDKEKFNERIENLENEKEENVEFIVLSEKPIYKLAIIGRDYVINENEVLEAIIKNADLTYKFFAITLNGEAKELVGSLEEAIEILNQLKEEYSSQNTVKLGINEMYTKNINEIEIIDVKTAKVNMENIIENAIIEEKEEEEKLKRTVNGIELAVLPIEGIITSRYATASKIRVSSHTGLDIAAVIGTPIKAVAGGVVTNANTRGSYGKLVIINHGNGVETYYAHTSQMYVSVGEEVEAGQVIAAVGSTGNSTGPHLHLEVRLNGTPMNPQDYIYQESE